MILERAMSTRDGEQAAAGRREARDGLGQAGKEHTGVHNPDPRSERE